MKELIVMPESRLSIYAGRTEVAVLPGEGHANTRFMLQLPDSVKRVKFSLKLLKVSSSKVVLQNDWHNIDDGENRTLLINQEELAPGKYMVDVQVVNDCMERNAIQLPLEVWNSRLMASSVCTDISMDNRFLYALDLAAIRIYSVADYQQIGTIVSPPQVQFSKCCINEDGLVVITSDGVIMHWNKRDWLRAVLGQIQLTGDVRSCRMEGSNILRVFMGEHDNKAYHLSEKQFIPTGKCADFYRKQRLETEEGHMYYKKGANHTVLHSQGHKKKLTIADWHENDRVKLLQGQDTPLLTKIRNGNADLYSPNFDTGQWQHIQSSLSEPILFNAFSSFRQLRANMAFFTIEKKGYLGVLNRDPYQDRIPRCVSDQLLEETLYTASAMAHGSPHIPYAVGTNDGKVAVYYPLAEKHSVFQAHDPASSFDVDNYEQHHMARVTCLSFDSAGEWLFSGGLDSMLKAWRLTAPQEGKDISVIPDWNINLQGGNPQDMKVLPHGILAVSNPEHLLWFNYETGEQLACWRAPGGHVLDPLAYHPARDQVFVGDWQGEIHVFSLNKKEKIHTLQTGQESLFQIAFLNDKHLLVVTENNRALLVDIDEKKVIGQMRQDTVMTVRRRRDLVFDDKNQRHILYSGFSRDPEGHGPVWTAPVKELRVYDQLLCATSETREWGYPVQLLQKENICEN